jgi:ribosome-binding protein aMBF1 (putative translation factor)
MTIMDTDGPSVNRKEHLVKKPLTATGWLPITGRSMAIPKHVIRDISKIADRVLAARTLRGLGSRELARLAGMSAAATSRVEHYRRGITVQTVFRLADALRVRRAWLITGEGRMELDEKD